MATETSAAASTVSSTAQAKGPATLIIAGVLALALGGVGVAAVVMGKKTPSLAAQNDAGGDKAAADKLAAEDAAKAQAGVPAQATLRVAPQEDAPLPVLNAQDAAGASAFPQQDDPSLK